MSLGVAAMSYTQLFAARVGVSIGEAGCAPPAHSLIAEYFPRERRATAMSTSAVGAPLGLMVVSIVGGYIAQHYGWRYALATFGMAVVLVALLLHLNSEEPTSELQSLMRISFAVFCFTKT